MNFFLITTRITTKNNPKYIEGSGTDLTLFLGTGGGPVTTHELVVVSKTDAAKSAVFTIEFL